MPACACSGFVRYDVSNEHAYFSSQHFCVSFPKGSLVSNCYAEHSHTNMLAATSLGSRSGSVRGDSCFGPKFCVRVAVHDKDRTHPTDCECHAAPNMLLEHLFLARLSSTKRGRSINQFVDFSMQNTVRLHRAFAVHSSVVLPYNTYSHNHTSTPPPPFPISNYTLQILFSHLLLILC
jgi:hypothetical protein